MNDLKIKPLTIEQLTISIDRLTRFKNTETKYLRVFKELILSNLINPKFKKQRKKVCVLCSDKNFELQPNDKGLKR